MKDLGNRIDVWFNRHPVLSAVLWGAAGFAFAAWGSNTPKEQVLFLLIGCGAFAIAGYLAQERYLARTCYRDLRKERKDDFDPAFVVESTDELGWATGRDLRETLHSGEIVLAVLGALALGIIAAGFAAGFFVTAVVGADSITANHANWSKVIIWGVGIVAALFSLDILVGEPLSGLRYWFASRRLIEREQLNALKILAAAANRDN